MQSRRIKVSYVLFGLCLQVPPAAAQQINELVCVVKEKADAGFQYSKQLLEKGQFSVRVRTDTTSATIQRCGHSPIQERVTCDMYRPDHIVLDGASKIIKYYFFRSHFDVQIFPDLSFIENNGRGSIARGNCVKE